MQTPITQSPNAPINATRQIQLIHKTLVDELSRAVQFAALGDRYAELAPDVELPPYRAPLAFGIVPGLESAVRADFAGQSARFAALAMLASVGTELRRLLTLRRTVEHIARAREIAPLKLERIAAEVSDECRDRGERELLLAIVTESRPELDEAKKWLDGLVMLREPLARNGGMVENDDVPNASDGIRVVWRKSVVALDGNQFEELSQALPGHPGLGVRFIEQARVFRRGQLLGLASSDCHDIAISLSCLSLALCEQLHREIGVLLAEASER